MATGTSADILIDQLLALSRAEKKLVLQRLLDSLLDDTGETWEQAWEKELLRREEQDEKGLTVYHTEAEFKAHFEKKFANERPSFELSQSLTAVAGQDTGKSDSQKEFIS